MDIRAVIISIIIVDLANISTAAPHNICTTFPYTEFNNWIYISHTKILYSNESTQPQYSMEMSFLYCLNRCKVSEKCRAVSYTYSSMECLQFVNVAQTSVKFVDFNYGVVSAFKLTSQSRVDGNELRFTEETQEKPSLSKSDSDSQSLIRKAISYSARQPQDSSNNVRQFTLKLRKLISNLGQFSVLPRHDLVAVPGAESRIEEISIDDLDTCLTKCLHRDFCSKVAFSGTKCRMTSTSALTKDVKQANADSNVFIRQAKLASLLSFHQRPGWKLTGNARSIEAYECDGKNCFALLSRCAESCLSKYAKWCRVISVEFEETQVMCRFYGGNAYYDLVPSWSSIILPRYFIVETRDSQRYEANDFHICLESGLKLKENQVIRGRRGLFETIGDALKGTAESTVDVMKVTAQTAVDTAKDLVQTAGKVVQGDFQ